ncbi:helix-turn-helix domain-containing protein [Gordonibacter massiliensis (ex Traore et al. 2017)]|uniref:helix-turn-helix domain-containing protein n=1 Tax=Gordonibacter massiliensis (ex Traore et al. 2017) TaxID=1841863 RepID=UPI001ED59781|nr:helix-turn-helix transcriptional regulator [Gordonibacter massiliensis (ex Traore et al. 2017)]
MAIETRLDEVMAERGVKLIDLAERVGLTNANLSHIKTGKIRAIRFATLDALCEELDCQPGDILVRVPDD